MYLRTPYVMYGRLENVAVTCRPAQPHALDDAAKTLALSVQLAAAAVQPPPTRAVAGDDQSGKHIGHASLYLPPPKLLVLTSSSSCTANTVLLLHECPCIPYPACESWPSCHVFYILLTPAGRTPSTNRGMYVDVKRRKSLFCLRSGPQADGSASAIETHMSFDAEYGNEHHATASMRAPRVLFRASAVVWWNVTPQMKKSQRWAQCHARFDHPEQTGRRYFLSIQEYRRSSPIPNSANIHFLSRGSTRIAPRKNNYSTGVSDGKFTESLAAEMPSQSRGYVRRRAAGPQHWERRIFAL